MSREKTRFQEYIASLGTKGFVEKYKKYGASERVVDSWRYGARAPRPTDPVVHQIVKREKRMPWYCVWPEKT